MSKFVNIKVSALVSTDFFIEVPDDAPEAKVRELAEKEVTLPHDYPRVLDNILKTRMGIQVYGIDSMLRSWDIEDLNYLIDGGNYTTPNIGTLIKE